MRSKTRWIGLVLGVSVLYSLALAGISQAQVSLGSIIGRVRVTNQEEPSQRILVTLELRGAPMDSVYTDSQGTFGFHNLHPDSYYITISDEQYQPIRMEAVIQATSLSPTVLLDVSLVPKNQGGSADAAKQPGANPNMTDAREYAANFPKAAVREFEKGVQSDGKGKKDVAIRHYQRAVEIAPDFYAAHNNLGSDQLSKSDFAGARAEFEKVIELNQSDAAGYFNLGNVCMLMGQMGDAQRFLDEGIRRQPDSALGQFLMGSLNYRLGKTAEAERDLRRAIQLSPEMVQPRLQLVNLYLQQGRKQDAAEVLRAFIDAFPDNGFNPKAKQLLQQLEGPAKAATSQPQ